MIGGHVSNRPRYQIALHIDCVEYCYHFPVFSIVYVILNFFFFNHPPTTEIHTFPTRRSSDLTGNQTLRPWPVTHQKSACSACICPNPRENFFRAVVQRSEEHTSELQSRQYLVCRLLLEKKKQAPR